MAHYNYFRDYDPTIGRYIESDSKGLTGGINTFAYVSSQSLRRSDRDGLTDIPGADLDPDYGWHPAPGDSYPEPVDDRCMLLCVTWDLLVSHSLASAASKGGGFMAGSGSAGIRVAGAIGGGAARAFGHTPSGAIIDLGLAMNSCEEHCRIYPGCPDWAKGYQNMPIPIPFPH
jgi:uncharacterized protein RhaS with RHS repeats